jgi:hypothetical protein
MAKVAFLHKNTNSPGLCDKSCFAFKTPLMLVLSKRQRSGSSQVGGQSPRALKSRETVGKATYREKSYLDL